MATAKSKEIVNPTMGSVLRGRFDGASRQSLPRYPKFISPDYLQGDDAMTMSQRHVKYISRPFAGNYDREVRDDRKITPAMYRKFNGQHLIF